MEPSGIYKARSYHLTRLLKAQPQLYLISRGLLSSRKFLLQRSQDPAPNDAFSIAVVHLQDGRRRPEHQYWATRASSQIDCISRDARQEAFSQNVGGDDAVLQDLEETRQGFRRPGDLNENTFILLVLNPVHNSVHNELG